MDTDNIPGPAEILFYGTGRVKEEEGPFLLLFIHVISHVKETLDMAMSEAIKFHLEGSFQFQQE